MAGEVTDMTGAAIALGEVISDGEFVDSATGQGVRVVYKHVSGSGASIGSDSFTYSVTDGNTTVTAPVIIQEFRIPTPSDFDIAVEEDGLG